jgi:hypothetical protein
MINCCAMTRFQPQRRIQDYICAISKLAASSSRDRHAQLEETMNLSVG